MSGTVVATKMVIQTLKNAYNRAYSNVHIREGVKTAAYGGLWYLGATLLAYAVGGPLGFLALSAAPIAGYTAAAFRASRSESSIVRNIGTPLAVFGAGYSAPALAGGIAATAPGLGGLETLLAGKETITGGLAAVAWGINKLADKYKPNSTSTPTR